MPRGIKVRLLIIGILLVILIALLTNCAPEVPIKSVQTESEIMRGATYLGEVNWNSVYRFLDGDRACYLVDGGDSVALWCEEG